MFGLKQHISGWVTRQTSDKGNLGLTGQLLFFAIDGGIVRLCPHLSYFWWNHQLMVKSHFFGFNNGEITIFVGEIIICHGEITLFLLRPSPHRLGILRSNGSTGSGCFRFGRTLGGSQAAPAGGAQRRASFPAWTTRPRPGPRPGRWNPGWSLGNFWDMSWKFKFSIMIYNVQATIWGIWVWTWGIALYTCWS